ncbi:MAG: CtsR family transcriptional regulator [Eubacterium sp.]|nr:CtsR family transcriptional regulator [Eubacterium sp.]
MKMSDLIADMILDMFDDNSSSVQIQRNDLANRLGCVPSQINYVITSRFTPEAGYRIESRRGGGGYILITRADSKDNALLGFINSIGDEIDERTARANIYNLNYQKLISDKAAAMMDAVVKQSNFRDIPEDRINSVRARQLKQILLAYIN